MLLPNEQSPWNCAYALGAYALDCLSKAPSNGLDTFQLQQEMSKKIGVDLSITQVTLGLTWLFLIDQVEVTKEGVIKKCS